jgi:hypothetical protein
MKGLQIQGADSVKSLLIGSTTSEQEQLLIDGIVAKRTVRTTRRNVSIGVDLLPRLVRK